MNKAIIGIAIATLTTGSLLGCSKTEEGVAMGAIVGGALGQAIGGDTSGTVLGAGIGAVVGGAISDKQQGQQDRQYQQQQANGTTVRRTTVHETLDANGNVIKTGTTTTTSTQTTGGYTGLED